MVSDFPFEEIGANDEDDSFTMNHEGEFYICFDDGSKILVWTSEWGGIDLTLKAGIHMH